MGNLTNERSSRRDFVLGAGLGLAATALAANTAEARADAAAGARNDSRFNVKDFGAKGDGKTPDSAAIQRALDAAGAVQGTVWFPAGVYRCHDLKASEHVTLLADPNWIWQAHKSGAVLELDDPNATCLLNVTGAYGVRVRGLLLNGIRDAAKPVHGILQRQDGWSQKEDTFVFDDIKVMNFSGHGVYLDHIWLFIVRHSHFMANGGDGFRIRGWDGFVTDNQFSRNGGHGFGCEEVGATVMFTANRVEWNGGHGLSLVAGDDWNVTGNSFDRNFGPAVCAVKTCALTLTGNVFRRSGRHPERLPEGDLACQVRLDGCRGLAMTGNACRAGRDDRGEGEYTPEYGFILKNLDYSVVSANTLHDGFMKQMILDLGGHGKDFILKDNVGRPMVVDATRTGTW